MNADTDTARRVALVTGGSRGIGLGIAAALARDGFDLAINGRRDRADIEPVLRDLADRGVRVIYCRADIAQADQRSAMLADIREAFGRLDVLVNNAGVAPTSRDDLLDATEESFDRVVGINLKGPYFLTQAAARWMLEQARQHPAAQRRCIVNVGSVSATVASVNRGDYCLSKAGVAMATRLWAARLADEGVDVYEVRPGITATDMTAGVKQKYDDLIAAGLTVERRWGTPEDVGKAVACLARGDLPYATGQAIVVDGGLTLPRL